MMRKLLTLMVIMGLVFGVTAAGWAGENPAPMNTDFAGGLGTSVDPWQIATADQLNNVRNYLGPDQHFILVDDIDLNVAPYNIGAGWVPIGATGARFQGHFDGDGKTIANLLINNTNQVNAGLFGFIESADIRNVTLLDANITANEQSGCLAGQASNSVITTSTVTGVINSYEFIIGGLLGRGDQTSINGCRAAVNVNGLSNISFCIGGLVGIYVDSSINDSYATGAVFGYTQVGGLVGSLNDNSTVNASFASGTVSGDTQSGGLVGANQFGSSITNSYATGTVSCNSRTGGLVGFLLESSVTASYATGAVSGSSDVGGLVGLSSGTTTASYYDQESSGQDDDTGKGEPRSNVDMTFPYNPANTYLGWDFTGTWDIQPGINNGYPILWWQEYTPVNKTALATAIAAAQDNKDSVQVSVDGSDVNIADEWVTQAFVDDYEAAIAAAQAVYDHINASQQQVDDAVAALAAATDTFDAAKQPGTFSPEPQPGDDLRDRMDTIKEETEDRFDDIKEETKESFDDKKQETSDRFADLKTSIKGRFSR